MMPKRVLNWKPDLPDHRDLYLKVSRFRVLPQKVDLRPKCSTVEDQEDIGSCSAQAFVANMEYLDRVVDDKWTNLSRLFVYYNSRDSKGEDTGAYLRDGIKALATFGAPDEDLWPYIPSKYAVKPPLRVYRQARKRCITKYERIGNFRGVQQSLADGYPVVFGFSVYENFNSIGKDGIMSMPSGRMEGGHAVLAVGYDNVREVLIVRNSWGSSWGDAGYFYMPYLYADNSDLTADWWTITRTPHLTGIEGDIDIDSKDVMWYLPITSIIRFTRDVWKRLFKKEVSYA